MNSKFTYRFFNVLTSEVWWSRLWDVDRHRHGRQTNAYPHHDSPNYIYATKLMQIKIYSCWLLHRQQLQPKLLMLHGQMKFAILERWRDIYGDIGVIIFFSIMFDLRVVPWSLINPWRRCQLRIPRWMEESVIEFRSPTALNMNFF